MSFIISLFQAPNVSRPYSYFIDCLRGLAALVVLFAHYNHFGLSDPTLQPFYTPLRFLYDSSGTLAVWLFWVISGFVFAQTYLFRNSTTWTFFVHRVARLYPLHFLTLLVVAGLQYLIVASNGASFIYGHNDWYHFLLNLFFIPAWGFQVDRSFNGPVWSVSVELLIYAIFWCSLWLLVRGGLLTSSGFIVMFTSLYMLGIPGSSFWLCGLFFYAGVATYIIVTMAARQFQQFFVVSLLVCGAVMCKTYLAAWWLPMMACLLPAIVLLCSMIDVIDTQQVGKRMSHFGDLAYGVYLWHVPVQLFLLYLLTQHGISRDVASSPWFLLLFVGMVYAIAHVSFVYFEAPMRRYVRERLVKN